MEKKCRICEKTKPLDEAHFHRRPEAKDGFRNECRECIRKKQETYNRKLERKERRAEYDNCNSAKGNKMPEDFLS